jgi:hypothetical protein
MRLALRLVPVIAASALSLDSVRLGAARPARGARGACDRHHRCHLQSLARALREEIRGDARYSNFKQFTVEVESTVRAGATK